MSEFFITREIGIDMGHRVTHHGSKCRNLHGHRYTIEATCRGTLYSSGASEGMVLDFGFLKEEMMDCIDRPCDHGTTLWIEDNLALDFIQGFHPWQETRDQVLKVGSVLLEGRTGKLYLVNFVPTAENLARHWFKLLEPRVLARGEGNAFLDSVKVWETPNCSAIFGG